VELKPAPIIGVPRSSVEKEDAARAAEQGEALLARGAVAPLVVAGGQGTRLGFDGPKGAFPIGPLSGKPLFAFFAEKILATQRRFGKPIPWYVMTSPANDRDTREFFRTHRFFGLREDQLFFFVQGTLPAVDPRGRIFLSSRSQLSLSPDGHGGTLRALAESGALDDMERRAISDISYFQVDNVLVRVLDPVFIGYHARAGAEMSSKVLRKASPEEKVGVIGVRDGKLGVIEYSDLSPEQMAATGPDGELTYWAGSIAMHMLHVPFIRRLQAAGIRLPFHRADKKVPHIDAHGNPVSPERPNGIKFESFLFDARRNVI
jgi:UDP-N-acetylglucosamine/UDP-N-acetylgalactosamine diphosphorylase